MTNEKEKLFALTPINFKEGKSQSNHKQESLNILENLNKCDPLVLCRTCANKDPCLVPIFKEEGLNYNLNKKINKYLPIKVSEEDDLPLHLCYHCASTLIAWDSLLEGCVKAEEKLLLIKNSWEKTQDQEILREEDELLNENIDSEDEPLIKKRSSEILHEVEVKKDIIESKNDLLPVQQPVDIELGRNAEKSHRVKENPNLKFLKESKKKCSKWKKSVTYSVKKRLKSNKSESQKEESVYEDSPHKCPVCRKTYKDIKLFWEDLYAHLKSDSLVSSEEPSSNICKVCNATYEISEQLSEHILLHVNSKKLEDKKEQRGFNRMKKMEEETSKFKCEICGKVISRKYAMKRHLATHSGEKKFTCHHCGKQYAQESGLQRHVLVIHEGVRKYKCPICSKIFGSNSELKCHQDMHTDPRPFQCDQCGRTFVSQKNLYHHRKYHHTANGMRKLCKICNRFFSSPSVLKRHHKVVHLGIKEFQCHICSAQLSTKHYLQEHLRLHSDERPEVCSFCGKTFQMAGNLRQHIKIHLGKTQICYVCGKGFTRRCHLLIHMGSHRELEHPRCEHCSQIFLIKNDFEKHMKEHSTKVVD